MATFVSDRNRIISFLTRRSTIGPLLLAAASFFVLLNTFYHHNIPNFSSGEVKAPRKLLVAGHSIHQFDPKAPELAWLMAYPRSGGDYLIDIIHRSTSHTTASNYGNLLEESSGINERNTYRSVPVFSNRINGPFLFTHHLPLPSTYIPVTTSCAADSYCYDCFPGRHMAVSRDAFIKGCSTATLFAPSDRNDGENTFGTSLQVNYDGGLVKKALVVMRNPMDVVEERFLFSSRSFQGEKNEWQPRFPLTDTGFHRFCHEQDDKMYEENKKWYEEDIMNASKDVPCHAEFIKLVRWYNLLFESLDHLEQSDLDGHEVMYYEDFINTNDKAFAVKAEHLLKYYQLTPLVDLETMKRPPITTAGGNLGYLTEEEKVKAVSLMNTVAIPVTKKFLIDRYFQV